MQAPIQGAQQRERNRWLYLHAPGAVWGGLGLVVLTALTLWRTVDTIWLSVWTGSALLGYGGWLALITAFRRARPERHGDPSWEHRFIALAAVNGVIWGSGGLAFYSASPALEQTVMLTVLVVLGASTSLYPAASRWIGPAFIVPAVTPVASYSLLQADRVHLLLGIVLLGFTVGLLVAQRQVQRSLLEKLSLQRDNETLLANLSASTERLGKAQRMAGFGDWEWDLGTGRLHWSDEVFHLYDFEPGQWVDRSVLLTAIHPADQKSYLQALDAMLDGGPAMEVEFRIVRSGGEVRYLRDVAELIRDEQGRPVRAKGVTSDISDRVEAESRTERAWREFNRVLDSMQDTYFRADAEGMVTFVSRSVQTLLGFRADEVMLEPFSGFCARPGEWETFEGALRAGNGKVQNHEIQLRRKDGTPLWASVNAQYVLGSRGEAIGVEGIARDMSELKQMHAAFSQEKERVLVTLQSIGDGVVTTDEAGRVQYLNPVAERLLGHSADVAVGRHYLDLLTAVEEKTGESLADLVNFCLSGNTAVVHGDEGRFVHQDGTEYHLKITSAPMRDREGRVKGAVLVLHDITDVMGMAQRLSYQASHDTLTDLFNRQIFERRVEEAIREAQGGGGPHAVLYMDLDQFKLVNDTCGHPAGDQLLQQIAMLMQKAVRDTDILARLGGDEFGVLLEHCPQAKATEIAEAIRLAIHDFRFAWKDKLFDIGVSIGVVPVDASSASLAEVLSAADAACYVAKDHGRNRIHVYQLEDDAVALRHGEMEWVHRLSAAFEEDRFVLYAQPIAHLAGEQLIAHHEVLIRMLDDKGKVVPPMAFIPAAERYSLMPAIDRWVVRTTFTLMQKAQGSLAFPPLNCAINLSGQSLCDDRFLEFVVDLFDTTAIPPECVCFEITETAAIANLSRASRFIQVMRDMGCSFALDDFGSGLSSFGYLKSLAVDFLKIDGSFVKDVANDPVDRAIVESINQIGHVLGLKTIAEYVDAEAVPVLRELGVDYAQGYGIGHPQLFSDVLAASLEHIEMLAVN